jgi:hypothetical protein
MVVLLVLIGLAVAAIVATFLTETENFGWATLLLIVSVVVAQLFHVINLLTFVSDHGLTTILYVLGYLGVGVIWSFIKWFSFLMAFRDKFRTLKEEYLTSLKLNPKGQVPNEKLTAFEQFVSGQYTRYHGYGDSPMSGLSSLKRPRAAQNKARIVSWMSLWPCSFLGTLLNDPVRRLFNFLFNNFKAVYQKMADAVFRHDIELK